MMLSIIKSLIGNEIAFYMKHLWQKVTNRQTTEKLISIFKEVDKIYVCQKLINNDCRLINYRSLICINYFTNQQSKTKGLL